MKPQWGDETLSLHINSMSQIELDSFIKDLKADFTNGMMKHFELGDAQNQALRDSSSDVHHRFLGGLENFAQDKKANSHATIKFAGMAVPSCSGAPVSPEALRINATSGKHHIFITKSPGTPHPGPHPSPTPTPTPTPGPKKGVT